MTTRRAAIDASIPSGCTFLRFEVEDGHSFMVIELPRIRVKAGRRVISMEESFMSDSQWRPDEVARFKRGAIPIVRNTAPGQARLDRTYQSRTHLPPLDWMG